MNMDKKLYDILKWLALVALDAFGVAYEQLASVWGLPFGDQVCKTATILSVLIGVLIGVTSMQHTKQTNDAFVSLAASKEGVLPTDNSTKPEDTPDEEVSQEPEPDTADLDGDDPEIPGAPGTEG